MAKNSKGIELKEYPKLVKHPDTGVKAKVMNKAEEDKYLGKSAEAEKPKKGETKPSGNEGNWK